eukprot:1246689-Pleurochrysis_carterae.AAC.1
MVELKVNAHVKLAVPFMNTARCTWVLVLKRAARNKTIATPTLSITQHPATGIFLRSTLRRTCCTPSPLSRNTKG